MKHSRFTKKSPIAACLFAVLLTLVTSVVCKADNSFKLRINNRSPQVPIGKIKITLELASDPATASPATQLTVAGTALPSMDEIFFTLPSGDEVSFFRVVGTNHMIIEYHPRSHFDLDPMTSSINLCKTKPTVTLPQSVNIDFRGPVINGFRLNTYTVGKDVEGDTGQCDKASRRVKTNSAEVLPPDAGAQFTDMTTRPFLGRHPLDIILVLDKSGSMGWSLPRVSGGETRWDVLNDALDQFVATWKQADVVPVGSSPPPGGASAANVSGDRLGVVFFDTNAEAASLAGSFFRERGTLPATDLSHNWVIVANAPDSRIPGGSTALGKGLGLAIMSWRADPKNDPSIILMTDGIQNVDPRVTTQAGTEVVQLDPDGAGSEPNTDLAKFFIPMQSVAIGAPLSGSTEDELLNRIAKQTTGGVGVAKIVAEPATIAGAFIEALIGALKGNTLSLLTRTQDTLAAGADSNPPMPVLLDGSVRRATFVLGWEGGNRQVALDLQIRPPGAGLTTPPVTPVLRQNGIGWTVQSIDIPATGPIGDWSVRVIRRDGTNPAAVIPYHFSAYSVEGRLDYMLTFNPVSDGTGDAMVLRANVSFDGRPLSGINNGIRLKIHRPNEGLGTFLHNTSVSADVLGSEPPGVPPSPDTTTPYHRKILHLAQTPGNRKRVEPTELTDTFFLRDDGSAASGDIQANDGVYAIKFSDTSRPGLYRFKVTMEWDDPRTGRIYREETVERIVKVNADSQASNVRVDNRSGGGVVLINLTPRDTFGNYYGPSSTTPITVTLTGGGTVASITDRQQTGDYIIRIEGVPPGADPHVVIKVDERTITDADVSEIPRDGEPPSGFRRWGLSLHAGASIPHGNFDTVFNPGPNFGVDLEYRIKPNFSLEGIYTFHRFRGQTFGFVTVGDINLHQVSANGKIYGSSAPVRPFFNFGGGVYKFDPGPTRGGLNVGGGMQVDITPKIAVDYMYNFHNVFTSGSSVKFSTVQGGVRFRF